MENDTQQNLRILQEISDFLKTQNIDTLVEADSLVLKETKLISVLLVDKYSSGGKRYIGGRLVGKQLVISSDDIVSKFDPTKKGSFNLVKIGEDLRLRLNSLRRGL